MEKWGNQPLLAPAFPTDAFGNAVANSIVRGLSKPKTYEEGDTYTNKDGSTSIVGNVDDKGQPTVLINAATKLEPFVETNHWEMGGKLFENRELYLGAVLDANYQERQAATSDLSNRAHMNAFWTSIQDGAKNPFT